MVVGAFPIAKLSVLLIKQISKPIANVCKERAKNHPFFRTYVCMPPAQFYNWCEVKAKMWILNLGRPVNIPVLSQEMAIELGANLLGETVIFVIGAGLLIFEYNRQSKKEAAKEAKREQELLYMTNTITDLYFTVQQQQTQLREIERIIVTLGGPEPSTPAPVIKPPKVPPTVTPPPKDGVPPPPTAGVPPPPMAGVPLPPAPIPPKKNTECEKMSTPYPNKGIILQSLNYIQMDVFSAMFPNNYSKVSPPEGRSFVGHQRQPALLSEALNSIEKNFRSLF